MPNIGALTTFKPNPTCSSYNGYTETINGQGVVYYVQGPIATKDCYPDGYNPSNQYYFSPGVECPAGYSLACQFVNPGPAPTETVRTCCPIVGTYSCQGPIDSHFPWQSTLGCLSNVEATATLAPITHVDGKGTTALPSRIVVGGAVGAEAIVIRFQQSDMSKTSTSLSATASASSAATAVAASGQTTVSAASSGGRSGLSSSAAAGIGVACGVGTLLGVLGMFVLWKRRRSSSQHSSSAAAPEAALQEHMSTKSYTFEIPDTSAAAPSVPPFARSREPYHQQQQTHTSPSTTDGPHELPTDTPQELPT